MNSFLIQIYTIYVLNLIYVFNGVNLHVTKTKIS